VELCFNCWHVQEIHSLCGVQTGSEGHLTTQLIGTEGISREVKLPEREANLPTCSVELRVSGTISSLPHTPLWPSQEHMYLYLTKYRLPHPRIP
jgi:hypothetical protein